MDLWVIIGVKLKGLFINWIWEVKKEVIKMIYDFLFYIIGRIVVLCRLWSRDMNGKKIGDVSL